MNEYAGRRISICAVNARYSATCLRVALPLGLRGFEPHGAEVVSCGQVHGASRAVAKRRIRAMAGSVPPSSLHSISSVVMSARPARSATLMPSA